MNRPAGRCGSKKSVPDNNPHCLHRIQEAAEGSAADGIALKDAGILQYPLKDGAYDARVILESVSPLSFLIR